jgi:hypothetical protein
MMDGSKNKKPYFSGFRMTIKATTEDKRIHEENVLLIPRTI